MTRKLARRFLPPLLASSPFSCCSAGTLCIVTGISFCVASFAADVAMFFDGHVSVDTTTAPDLARCDAAYAVLHAATLDHATSTVGGDD